LRRIRTSLPSTTGAPACAAAVAANEGSDTASSGRRSSAGGRGEPVTSSVTSNVMATMAASTRPNPRRSRSLEVSRSMALRVMAYNVRAMKTRDLHVETIRPLVPPAILLEELPLSEEGSRTIASAREAIVRILNGEDDRLVVIVGPCSIHDPVAGMEYARRLHALAAELAADLCIVMRVYFEKPRTTVGWKGLINDPSLDGSFSINRGLRLARR